jgi:hypothetical protein
MLSFDDDRWVRLCGGYQVPVDLRPLLTALERAENPEDAWCALWQEAYHQGDVGEASYAAVPHLVRIDRARGERDWNAISLAGAIELARLGGNGPDVPSWGAEAYSEALVELARLGLRALDGTNDKTYIASVLGLVAVTNGLHNHGRLLLEYTDDELREFIDLQ